MTERRHVREQRGLDVVARDEQLDRVPAGGPRRVDQILTFRDEQPQLLAPAAFVQLADELELLVVG